MKKEMIQKIGGVSVILGSFLLTMYSIAFSFLLPVNVLRTDFIQVVQNSNWIWISSVAFIGIILMIFGFTVVYSKIYKEAGFLGFIGYVLVIIAYIFQACKVTWEIFLYPVIAGNSFCSPLLSDAVLLHSNYFVIFRVLASFLVLIGVILFSVALIIVKEYPKSGGYLILIGALMYGVGPVVNIYVAITGIFIFSLGCFVLGRNLYKTDHHG